MLWIKKAVVADIPVIRGLALQIWPETYKKLLSPDQVKYMLDLFYSLASLENQIAGLHHQFILAYNNDVPVGFASFAAKQEGIDEKSLSPGSRKLTTEEKEFGPAFHKVYHLHKIYVSQAVQGKGTGRFIIDHIINEIKGAGATALELHVKRDNPAIHFYQKLGFTIQHEIDTNIGNGYYMRDYLMQKEL